jgi:hypothetical protein
MDANESAILAVHYRKFHSSWNESAKNEPPWKVEDSSFAHLIPLVVGRTIVRIERTPNSGSEFEQGANQVTVYLDNGAEIHFGSWGYDADGCTTSYAPAKIIGERDGKV